MRTDMELKVLVSFVAREETKSRKLSLPVDRGA
jgi:hypothetical protein